MVLTRGRWELALVWNWPVWAWTYGRWRFPVGADDRAWFARVRLGWLKVEATRWRAPRKNTGPVRDDGGGNVWSRARGLRASAGQESRHTAGAGRIAGPWSFLGLGRPLGVGWLGRGRDDEAVELAQQALPKGLGVGVEDHGGSL